MIIKGLKLSQADEHLYHELIRLGYPEDRIQPGYRVSENYRSDFTIMAPGVSDIPIAVFEVKGFSNGMKKDRIKTCAREVEKVFGCDFYLYTELEDTYKTYKISGDHFLSKDIPSYRTLLTAWHKKANYLKNVHVSNFCVFREADFSFGRKINLIIGENGSGKTQLLKLLYSIATSALKHTHNQQKNIAINLLDVTEIFKIDEEEELINRAARKKGEEMSVTVQFNNAKDFSYKIGNDGGISVFNTPPKNMSIPSVVFLPSRELLSIFPSFLSFAQTYGNKWPYDATYVDTMSYLGLQPLASQSIDISRVCRSIEKSLDGHFYLDTQRDKFLLKRNGEEEPYEIDMTAEGWRKLGEILLLLKNGAISQGSILLWDEPEANLNPILIKLVASTIFELGNLGVHIFLTTHSLFFMRELEYLSHTKKCCPIRYFSLHNGNVEQGDSSADLSNIASFEEEIKQEDRIFSCKG